MKYLRLRVFLAAYFFGYPGGAFLVAAAITNRSQIYLLSAAGAVLFARVCRGISGLMPSLEDGRANLNMLLRPNHLLEPVDEWAELLPPSCRPDFVALSTFTAPLVRKYLRSMGFGEPLRRTLVFVRSFRSPPFDTVLKAYASFSGNSFVFLLDRPTSKGSAYARFKFFHEMGHVSMQVTAALMQSWYVIFVYAASAVLVLCLSLHNWLMWGTVAALFLAAGGSFARRRPLFEQRADWYALRCLKSLPEVAEVVDRSELAWCRNALPTTFEYAMRLQWMRIFLRKAESQSPGDIPMQSWNRSNGLFIRGIAWGGSVTSGALCRYEPGFALVFVIFALALLLQLGVASYLTHRALSIQRRIESTVQTLSLKLPRLRVTLVGRVKP